MKKKEPKAGDKADNFSYPADQDIYSKSKEEQNIDPEDTTKLKVAEEDEGLTVKSESDFDADVPGKKTKVKAGKKKNETDSNDEVSGSELDFQRSEFDEDDKRPGNEDEENDYYSLGGDDHNDLDEDRGE